ncbi:hypothetical protein GGF32_002854 [Allomyces javanicus]|nr:hypothetical protein GGF32_002854 [Allomyces javanicus]
MSLVTLFLAIAVPWAVRQYQTYRAQQNGAKPLYMTTPPSRTERVLDALLKLLVVACLARATVWREFDLFGTTGLILDAPTWALRSALIKYFDAHGWVPTTDRLSLDFVVPKADPGIAQLAMSGSPADRAIFTYHALRQDPARRGVYARFGATPLLACSYCRDPSDYALFALPDLLAPYLVALVVLGAATSAFRWQHWRRSALAALAALAVTDFTARVGFGIPLGVLATWLPWLALRPDLVHYSVTQLQMGVFGVLAALLAMFPQQRLLKAGDLVQQAIAPKLVYALQMAQSIPAVAEEAGKTQATGGRGEKR